MHFQLKRSPERVENLDLIVSGEDGSTEMSELQ